MLNEIYCKSYPHTSDIITMLSRTLYAALLTVTISSCATNIAGRNQVMLVSESKAIEASKQAYVNTLQDFEKQGKLDNDAQLVQRVNRITNKLITQAKLMRRDTQKWEWSVKVIDDPKTVNAWCMAGGKMAIYSGLIQQLNATDDEIAQVMGHEISHALANHSAEQMSIAMANNLALELLKTTGSQAVGSLGAAAAQVAISLPNSRTGETEADKIGIELAARAGYDPNAAVSLWQKMAKVGGGKSIEFLSTHPSPGNREKKLRKLIPKMMPYYLSAKK